MTDVQRATLISKPVVLTVDAYGMHQAGHVFRVSENGVWLVERVPAEFLRLPG